MRPFELQKAAFEHVRRLAKPLRLRVIPDSEGFPVVPGRYGHIEWYCDGADCHSCQLPGKLALAVHSARPRMFDKLLAIPGVRRWQTGDQEMRAVFEAPGPLAEVARVIGARRRRIQSQAQLASLDRARSKLPRLASLSGPPAHSDGRPNTGRLGPNTKRSGRPAPERGRLAS
jgi:hypothetical protein